MLIEELHMGLDGIIRNIWVHEQLPPIVAMAHVPLSINDKFQWAQRSSQYSRLCHIRSLHCSLT